MKYPDKYPKGFMYAAVNKQKPTEEQNEAAREGIQFFMDEIENALNGFIVADTPLVLAALYVYVVLVENSEPHSVELERAIAMRAKVTTTRVHTPLKDK